MEESKSKNQNEKLFVVEFVKAINSKLDKTKFELIDGKNLFYELTVNREQELQHGKLEDQIRRGKSAYQTDVIVFEKNQLKKDFPLIVFEFKLNPSTHDIIVYSAKARKHKQVYPWLRYGMLICGKDDIPIKKFLKHNEFLDFCVSVKGMFENDKIDDLKADKIIEFIQSEISIAQTLGRICFDNPKMSFYQNRIVIDDMQ